MDDVLQRGHVVWIMCCKEGVLCGGCVVERVCCTYGVCVAWSMCCMEDVL